MNKYLMVKEDIERIKSKSIYWEEVAKRSNGSDILKLELFEEIRILGVGQMLFILSEIVKE